MDVEQHIKQLSREKAMLEAEIADFGIKIQEAKKKVDEVEVVLRYLNGLTNKPSNNEKRGLPNTSVIKEDEGNKESKVLTTPAQTKIPHIHDNENRGVSIQTAISNGFVSYPGYIPISTLVGSFLRRNEHFTRKELVSAVKLLDPNAKTGAITVNLSRRRAAGQVTQVGNGTYVSRLFGLLDNITLDQTADQTANHSEYEGEKVEKEQIQIERQS